MENPDKNATNGSYWRLGLLLLLILLMADLFTRQAGLQVASALVQSSNRPTRDFLVVQIGDFHAEVQWNGSSKKPE